MKRPTLPWKFVVRWEVLSGSDSWWKRGNNPTGTASRRLMGKSCAQAGRGKQQKGCCGVTLGCEGWGSSRKETQLLHERGMHRWFGKSPGHGWLETAEVSRKKAVPHQALRSGTEQPVPWSSPKQLGFVPSSVLPPVRNT